MEKNQTKKNKFKLPFVILVYVLLIPLYSNSQINSDNSFVTYFDAIKMAKEHIPDFELINERLHWIYGRVFTFKNVKSNELIFFSVGIYHSNEVADTVAQDYFKYMSAAMDYGSANKLGDKYWSLSSISGNYTNIFFIRKNAFFRISSHNYSELMPFALKVNAFFWRFFPIADPLWYLVFIDQDVGPDYFGPVAAQTVHKMGIAFTIDILNYAKNAFFRIDAAD